MKTLLVRWAWHLYYNTTLHHNVRRVSRKSNNFTLSDTFNNSYGTYRDTLYVSCIYLKANAALAAYKWTTPGDGLIWMIMTSFVHPTGISGVNWSVQIRHIHHRLSYARRHKMIVLENLNHVPPMKIRLYQCFKHYLFGPSQIKSKLRHLPGL